MIKYETARSESKYVHIILKRYKNKTLSMIITSVNIFYASSLVN